MCPLPSTPCCQTNQRLHYVTECALLKKNTVGPAMKKWILWVSLLKCTTTPGCTGRQSGGQAVDTAGEIIDSGDPVLDGPVKNALEMIEKLAINERVEQVFVRHAFRFWMGRNETLNDAPVLQAAHKAYRENGGSMKALITSLLTSDAFLYRTQQKATH